SSALSLDARANSPFSENAIVPRVTSARRRAYARTAIIYESRCGDWKGAAVRLRLSYLDSERTAASIDTLNHSHHGLYRGPYCGTGSPSSSAPRSGAAPVKPSVTFGTIVPRSTAADPGRRRKSSALVVKSYRFVILVRSRASSGG